MSPCCLKSSHFSPHYSERVNCHGILFIPCARFVCRKRVKMECQLLLRICRFRAGCVAIKSFYDTWAIVPEGVLQKYKLLAERRIFACPGMIPREASPLDDGFAAGPLCSEPHHSIVWYSPSHQTKQTASTLARRAALLPLGRIHL